MCSEIPPSSVVLPGTGYRVTRAWSDEAVLAGHDPCVPSIGEPYFNSVPVMPTKVDILLDAPPAILTQGILIPVGQSKVVEVDLFSDAPTGGPWTLSAADMSDGTELAFSFDQDQGQNGDKRMMTIRVLKAGAHQGSGFTLTSTLGDCSTLWRGFVANQ